MPYPSTGLYPGSDVFPGEWSTCPDPPASAWSGCKTPLIAADVYEDRTLELGPWGYWRLNELGASGPEDALDSSGNARHGTYVPVNVAEFGIEGAIPGDLAIRCRGGKDNDETAVSLPTGGFPRSVFTIAFWCRPEEAITISSIVASSSGIGARVDGARWLQYPDHGDTNVGGGFAGFGVSIGTNGIVTAEHAHLYFPARAILEMPLGPDYVFVVITVKGLGGSNDPDEGHRIYLNGTYGGLIAEAIRYDEGAPDTGYTVFASGNIGRRVSTANYGDAFQGPIDEVALFDRILTDAEILSLYEIQQGELGSGWTDCEAPPATPWSNC